MRKRISKIKKVRAGKVVRISCALRKGRDLSRLGVWSAGDGGEMSPHTPMPSGDLMSNGMPMMFRPMMVSLHPLRRSHTFEFVADYAATFCVQEEMDMAGAKASAKIRISSHGQAYANFIRRLRNAFRRVWR